MTQASSRMRYLEMFLRRKIVNIISETSNFVFWAWLTYSASAMGTLDEADFSGVDFTEGIFGHDKNSSFSLNTFDSSLSRSSSSIYHIGDIPSYTPILI